MSDCCIYELDETSPPQQEGSGVLWFRCHLSSCHSGIGHVIVKDTSGNVLYDGNPVSISNKITWVPVDPAKLVNGGSIDINYDGTGHCCNAAIFDFGYVTDLINPIGTADLNNAGGPTSAVSGCAHVYTTFVLPPLVWQPPAIPIPTTKQVFFNQNYTCSATPPRQPIRKRVCVQVSGGKSFVSLVPTGSYLPPPYPGATVTTTLCYDIII